MRLFCMDVHISVIEDFKTITPPWVEVTDWCMSGHHWVLGKAKAAPKHINADTWKQMTPETIAAFQQEYDTFLRTFDGFVVGYAACFAMVFEKYNKPIIHLNAVRYDVPFCWSKDMGMLQQYKDCLHRLQRQGRLISVSNNKADQLYLQKGSGLPSEYIPAPCLYSGIRYKPTKPTFLCYHAHPPAHPLIAPHIRSGSFTWKELGEYRGIIHFPYEISTMSMFEHFAGGIPLFFPSKAFWKANSASLTSNICYWAADLPENLKDFDTHDAWIDLADPYLAFQSPNTYYYDSWEHLFQILETFRYVDDTAFRQEYIADVRRKWDAILRKIRPDRKMPPSFWLRRGAPVV
jgi:hypothetical protein